jgi:hypothetical protein
VPHAFGSSFLSLTTPWVAPSFPELTRGFCGSEERVAGHLFSATYLPSTPLKVKHLGLPQVIYSAAVLRRGCRKLDRSSVFIILSKEFISSPLVVRARVRE